MCGDLPSKSPFKISSVQQLKDFDIDALNGELVNRAPVLLTILKAAASKHPKPHKCEQLEL
jgi:hypothetical protein